jgi:hypothetical protein
MAFYVIGGVYENTKFETLVEGKGEKHGPFPTYDEAKKIWQSRSWALVDDCHARFTIEER